jgi:hypothetical protein
MTFGSYCFGMKLPVALPTQESSFRDAALRVEKLVFYQAVDQENLGTVRLDSDEAGLISIL